MSTDRLDAIRGSVLARMERAERLVRVAIAAAALTELVLIVVAIRLVDFHDPIQRLMFVFAILSYTIIAFGLVAVGAHVTRSVGRVLAALDTDGAGPTAAA